MQNYIICENLRSAYNVGNIIRTADALWRGVILSGYSAPVDHKKVKKTALGAEETVPIQHFKKNQEAIDRAKENWYTLISAEISEKSSPLSERKNTEQKICVIVGNELLGVEESSMEQSDQILHITMKGKKASVNVGQAAAIFMWELWGN